MSHESEGIAIRSGPLGVTDCLAGCETKEQAASAPPPVEFAAVAQKDVPVTKESKGSGMGGTSMLVAACKDQMQYPL